MKRVFLVFMLCFLGLYNPLKAQEAVADVKSTQLDQSNVDVAWSWSEIIPQTVVVNFETGDFSQANFVNDLNYPWVITEKAYEGSYAMKSSNQGQHGTSSSIEVTVDVPNDGMMSFYHKISCEYYFDNGTFYIDGVERDVVTKEVDWTYREYKVEKGQHTYRWSFRKDESDYTSGQDTYFVDNICLYTPEEEFNGGWIYYDDDHYVNAMGSGSYYTYWAVAFPETEEYAGYNLTKIRYYIKDVVPTVTVSVYLGGTDAPGELKSEKTFSLSSYSNQWVDLQLNTPVALDGTQPLWIAFRTNSGFGATACNYTGNPDSDWFMYIDENEQKWMHLAEIGEMMNMDLNFTWMIRGYLENSRGEVLSLSNERAHADVSGYNLYRTNVLTDETKLLSANTQDTVYRDAEWADLGYGIYKWGVTALYGTTESEIVYSNVLDKDMFTTVEVNVSTNSGDSPEGAKVQFVNIDEPDMGYNYKVRLDGSGKYVWEKFRRGTYEYTIALEGYESCAYKERITILDAKSLECTLTEIAGTVDQLYVSPTGYAMWQAHDFDNGGGEFYYNFDDGLLDGWRTIDADGDGFNWRTTAGLSMLPGNGYNSSKYCLTSQSYDGETGDLSPDNYIVTEIGYLMVEDSQLTYYVGAQDEQNPAEHYAVAVTTKADATPADFTIIWEETLASKSGSRQGSWQKRSIDLGEYAGQNLYIAFRHFDVTGQFRVNIDDMRLVNNGKKSRAVESYTVMLNGNVVAENVKDNFYQHENITAGETYTTSIIANYTTQESQAVEYTWTCASCEDYAGVESFSVVENKGKALVKWTMDGDEEQTEFDDSFSFSFNDATLNGWVTIDADGDGFNWCNSDSLLGEYGMNGHKDGLYCAMSQSYNGMESWGLHPDNYMVTAEKYLITENSQLSFFVCAQDPMFHEEHYGVAISLIGNTDAKDFETIWEETIESDDTDYDTPQTDWENKIIDLSRYAGETVYIAFRHFNCTDQYMICLDDVELIPGERRAKRNELIGFNVYCNGKIIARENATSRGIYVDFPGDDEYEYCVRAVYSDYAMSCPECATVDAPMICVAPKDLFAEVVVENGESGVKLTWPYQAPPMSDWLYYDDNSPITMIGLGGTMYWSIMFPAESLGEYIGTEMTKVKVYGGADTGEAAVLISYGTYVNPGEAISIQSFTYDGNPGWIEVELDQPVAITGKDHVWVTVFQSGMSYPAAISADCGDPNGRWVSVNGSQWYDLAALDASYAYTFMIRAFVTNETETNDVREIAANSESSRATEFDHYRVYRGTSQNQYEKIAEVTEGTYFDKDITTGTYYYKVTAVYVDGELDCESEPANSFKKPNEDYVVVDFVSIGEMGVDGMMIYPNPTRDNLTVMAENMNRITIVNTMGQVLYDQEVIGDSKDINMSQLEAGIYMVRITTENGVATQRVTVVK